jgi:hypothetical protein
MPFPGIETDLPIINFWSTYHLKNKNNKIEKTCEKIKAVF